MPRKTLTILLSTIILGVFLTTSEVFAQEDPYGLKTTAGAAGLQNDTPVTVLLGNVIGTALSLISVIFFALMIYGGFRWMLSRGNADEATKALDTIIAAIIGIIIVLASYAITNFVFSSLGTGGGGGGGAGGGSPTPPSPVISEEFTDQTGDPTCLVGSGCIVPTSTGACKPGAKNDFGSVAVCEQWQQKTEAEECTQEFAFCLVSGSSSEICFANNCAARCFGGSKDPGGICYAPTNGKCNGEDFLMSSENACSGLVGSTTCASKAIACVNKNIGNVGNIEQFWKNCNDQDHTLYACDD